MAQSAGAELRESDAGMTASELSTYLEARREEGGLRADRTMVRIMMDEEGNEYYQAIGIRLGVGTGCVEMGPPTLRALDQRTANIVLLDINAELDAL